MNARKIIRRILLGMLIVVAMTIAGGIPAYLIASKFLIADCFTDEIVRTQQLGQIYFVIPERALEGAILVDSQEARHYIISQERLRLLGPKLLTGEE